LEVRQVLSGRGRELQVHAADPSHGVGEQGLPAPRRAYEEHATWRRHTIDLRENLRDCKGLLTDLAQCLTDTNAHPASRQKDMIPDQAFQSSQCKV